MSYSEQKEKELEEEKKQKGLFIRFPWAKKEEKQTEELENPFGDVQLAPPRYQDLSELGIDTSKPAPGFETPAETASTHIPPVGAAPTAAVSNTPGTPAVHLPPVSPQAAAPVIPRSVAPQQGTVAVQDHSPTGISNPASGLTDPQSSNLHAGTGTFSGTLPAQLNVAPENSAVGFARLSGAFHRLTGVHMNLYYLSDWLSLIPVFIMIATSFPVPTGLPEGTRKREGIKQI